MHEKKTTFKIIKYEVLKDDVLVKTASEGTLIGGEAYDPDFLYLRVRAVSAGEFWGPNKNADYFEEAELKKHYKTFLQAHVFKNHENKDVKNAIGSVLEAVWNDDMKYVELLIKVDKKVAPTIVRGLQKGYMTDVSMGCKVKYTVCSVCGNVARTRKDFCNHISNPRLRNRVLPDGKKVFEINREFRFHDISVVLTGAEKPAKITEHVASVDYDNSLEKVASDNSFTLTEEIKNLAKQASDWVNTIDMDEVDENPFLKAAALNNKETFLQKVAEVKKRLTGKVIGIGGAELIGEKMADSKPAVNLVRLLYTNYWDENKCRNIALEIKKLADGQCMPYDEAFENFLSMANLMGIEISPLEYDRIQNFLSGERAVSQGAKEQVIETVLNQVLNNIAPDKFMESADNIMADSIPDDEIPVRTVIRMGMMPGNGLNAIANNLPDSMSVGPAVKTIAIRIIRPSDTVAPVNQDMRDAIFDLLKGEMTERSSYSGFINPRMMEVINNNPEPNIEGIRHFILPSLMGLPATGHSPVVKMALGTSGLGHAIQRMMILKQAESGELDEFIEKHASLIETGKDNWREVVADFGTYKQASVLGPKVIEDGFMNPNAFTRRRRLMLGIPGAFIYSKIQDGRRRRGDRISGFNEFAADNPEALALGQYLFGHHVFRALAHAHNGAAEIGRKTIKEQLPKIKELYGKDKEFKKKAEDYTFVFSKQANDILDGADQELGFSMNILDNPEIDGRLITREKYSSEQIGIIKQASLLMEMGREDATEALLKYAALTEKDLGNFIRVAKDVVKEELEKAASVGIGTILSQDFMTRKPREIVTSAPGMLLDAAIISGVIKKAEGSTNKTKQKAADYVNQVQNVHGATR